MISTIFYQGVTNLDYSLVEGGEIRGNSLMVDVKIYGRKGGEGIVYDFSVVKKKIKEIIDRECDHRLIISDQEKSFSLKNGIGLFDNGEIIYSAPADAFCILKKGALIEDIKKYLEEKIKSELPENITLIELDLYKFTEMEDGAIFFYTHGLKNHQGNCQRLLHGHRSTIKIWVDGIRATDVEQKVVQKWNISTHFIFRENIKSSDDLNVDISYKASQGEFNLTIPRSSVYILDCETTAENLNLEFLKLALEFVPKYKKIKVMATEGIMKGAISYDQKK